jgi:hypothetical protein
MKRRAAVASRGRSAQRRAPPPTPRSAPSGPARIPGIRIAHIGGGSTAVEPIRAYWQARGAVFLHHSLEHDEAQSRLEEVLARSHVVFHVHAAASSELGRNLRRYCERAEKPLILLEENSVWALAKALETGLPLA